MWTLLTAGCLNRPPAEAFNRAPKPELRIYIVIYERLLGLGINRFILGLTVDGEILAGKRELEFEELS